MQTINGLSEIVDAFDAVVTDQYGVLHDGKHVFPDALRTLKELAKRQLPVVTLTKSGKRAATNAWRLQQMGLGFDLVGKVISSGELARQHLSRLEPGTRIHLVSRDGETELVNGLELRLVHASDNTLPALVVLAGIRPERTSRKDYAQGLAPYAKAGVPMVLVNPDTLMVQRSISVKGPWPRTTLTWAAR